MSNAALTTLGPDASPDSEEAKLWTAFKTDGSPEAREKLFMRHAAFARGIAARHHREQSRGDIDFADLRQLAYTGLLQALDRFDPLNGAPFRAFALHRISGAVRDGLTRMTEVREQVSWRHRMRRERLQSLSQQTGDELKTAEAVGALAELAMGLALGFMLEGTGLFTQGAEEGGAPQPQSTAYDSAAWKEVVRQLHVELAGLSEREQIILREHYLNGVGFDNLAALMGVTKGRVSQLHKLALDRLRKRMGSRGHFRLEK